jgi:homoserine acetyltransferase
VPAEFRAGDVVLGSGLTLPDARIVYEVHGRPNAARDNVVVFPTRFGGTHADNAYLIGRGRALDPERWCVVVPNMIGNGVSSSPSTAPPPLAGGRFPATTIHDNVVLQGRLLSEVLGVERVALVVGWSMGGQQAYEWAAWFPERVARIAVLCGAARPRRTRTCSSKACARRSPPTAPTPKATTASRRDADCARSAAHGRGGRSRRPSTASHVRRARLLLARGLPRPLLGGHVPRA